MNSENGIDEKLLPSLTDDQVRLLALLNVVSGCLSIFGSLIIVHKVVRSRELSKSYDRIMLGLSSSNIVASIGYICRPFLLPEDTSTRVTAIGNDVSCAVLGWMTQFGFTSVVYNAVLSLYMLAVVRFSIKPADFAARFEPYLHALTIFYFLATATMAVPFGIYGEMKLGLGCWVREVPECSETGRHCFIDVIGWLFAGIPLFITFVILVVNNIVIVFHVRSKLRIEGQGRTRTQQIQIRRVATQGFLYVGAFFATYFAAVVVRFAASRGGARLSDEADMYNTLILQSALVPLQGFFNMLIYVRPTYMQLRHAGTSRWMAIRGAFLVSDLPKFLSEGAPSSPAPSQTQSSRVQSNESVDENPKDDPSNHTDDNQGETDEDGGSGDDFVDEDFLMVEDFVESERFATTTLPDSSSQPAKPILKSKTSTRINMDGSLTTS